jgi:hypothetical protein
VPASPKLAAASVTAIEFNEKRRARLARFAPPL